MNDVLYMYGLEILTKNAQTRCSLYICPIGLSFNANAQWLSHEVGVIAGPVAFQSDYGQRYNLNTNAGNTGLGIGIIHYINFSYEAECNCYTPDTILMTTLN
jgi:hypothetical protein